MILTMTMEREQTGIIFAKPLDCYLYVELLGDRIKSVEFRPSGELKKLPITEDLTLYFSGKPVDFLKYDVCLEGFTPFEKTVLKEVREIPYGNRVTYAELAERVGCSRSARAVGNALSKNRTPIVIPCHRVVGKESIGGYSQHIETKKRLLKIEYRYLRGS